MKNPSIDGRSSGYSYPLDTPSKQLVSKRSLHLDVFRVLFAVFVLMHHTYLLETPNGETILFGGYRGVEFFFIATGFLMANSIDKKELFVSPRWEVKPLDI